MTTRICFIRHGETHWNVDKRIQGQTDIPLETGRAHALAMAFSAGHHTFDAIYSSNLMRAHDTANMLAERLGLPVKLMLQLRERHYRIFQGINAAEGLQRQPETHARYIARDVDCGFESGENMRTFAARVTSGMHEMIRHHANQSDGAAAITCLRIMRFNHCTELSPRHQVFNASKKLRLAG